MFTAYFKRFASRAKAPTEIATDPASQVIAGAAVCDEYADPLDEVLRLAQGLHDALSAGITVPEAHLTLWRQRVHEAVYQADPTL